MSMEKLIELLNEYEKKAVVHWYEWYGQDVLMCRYIKDNFEFYTDEATTIAISKYYGFIKWLVENDKISNDGIKPRTDLVKEITIVDYKTGDAIGWKNKYTEVEQLIMYLSIQDKPIDFLISILK